jgi:D-cysteine desulfhydrase/L-cysteate sulfo-lyase
MSMLYTLDPPLAPRIGLSDLPTPLKPMTRLGDYLGINLWIKRDDCTGLAGGGNKTRKLEYLVGEALVRGADTLITLGAVQSNHARQTAAAAACLGLRCILLLTRTVQDRTEAYHNNGNILLDHLLGAEVRLFPAGTDLEVAAEQVMNECREAGNTPYLIPVGGSNAVGALAYVTAVEELRDQAQALQLTVGKVYLPTGSAGTHAGILAGVALNGLDWRTHGVSVSSSQVDLDAKLTRLTGETFALLGAGQTPMPAILVDDSQVGAGYGQPTPAMLEAVQLCARQDGILLDPVYTGKAMASLIADARAGRIAPGETVVFWHTGGSQGLFAYDDVFAV